MGKHCETFDHTADVGLAATADSLGELMEALAEGLSDVMCERGGVRPVVTRKVSLQAEDVEALAVDFLTGLLSAFDSEGFLLAEARVTMTGGAALTAELAGETYDPARHEVKTEVKAVTYHLLRVAESDGQWTGRLILDL